MVSRDILIEVAKETGLVHHEFSQADRFDTDLFSRYGDQGNNSKKPACRDCNGFPVRPNERTPGTLDRSKAGFTAFERPKDGEHEAQIEKIEVVIRASCGILRKAWKAEHIRGKL